MLLENNSLYYIVSLKLIKASITLWYESHPTLEVVLKESICFVVWYSISPYIPSRFEFLIVLFGSCSHCVFFTCFIYHFLKGLYKINPFVVHLSSSFLILSFIFKVELLHVLMLMRVYIFLLYFYHSFSYMIFLLSSILFC